MFTVNFIIHASVMVVHGITDIDPEHDLDEAPFWSGSPTMCQTGIPDAGGAGDLSIF